MPILPTVDSWEGNTELSRKLNLAESSSPSELTDKSWHVDPVVQMTKSSFTRDSLEILKLP